MSRKLTPKQKKFADNYIESGNATQAAIDAGYSKKYAHTNAVKLLQNTTLKSYIDKRMQEIEDEKIAGATEVLQYFTSVLRGKTTETVVVGGMMGAESIDKPPDIKARLAAGKELLKRYPNNDKLIEQQIRKLSAEAEVAEWKANELTNKNKASDKTVLVDDIGGDTDAHRGN